MFNKSMKHRRIVVKLNKAISTFSILCLLSILLLANCRTFVKGEAEVITVPDDYPTIQEAINSASNGDTIFVRVGTYYEHVVVNKSLSLFGENRESTIIDGNGTGNVVEITANNVSIVGFTIQNSGPGPFGDYGIRMSSDNSTISSNIITNNYYGIGIWLSKKNVISDNNVFSNNYGIDLFLAVNNTLFHNNFNNLYPAESDEYSTTIWDNGAEGNFWSKYTGKDSNGDGIGDTPYPIPPINQDSFPLMGMFSSFDVTSQGKTYKVTTISNSTISEFRFEIGLETGNKVIRLNVTGVVDAVGFCRIMFPTELMYYPYIILHEIEEIMSKNLTVSHQTQILYFTYIHDNRTITLISSKLHYLYDILNATYRELLNNYKRLNTTYYNLLNLYDNLNITYHDLLNSYNYLNTSFYELLNNYNLLLGNYSQLQTSYNELNSSYQQHLLDYYDSILNITNLTNLYYELLNTNVILQIDLYNLNTSFYELVNNYNFLLGDYSQLKTNYNELNSSYQEHLSNYSNNVFSIQNLTYVFAATTAIFLITTVYLSKHAHKNSNKVFES